MPTLMISSCHSKENVKKNNRSSKKWHHGVHNKRFLRKSIRKQFVHFIEKMICFNDHSIDLPIFMKPKKSIIHFYLGLFMKSSPLKIIQLSVLFVFMISAVSCGKDHDLMAEYVVSATLSSNDLAMLTMDDIEETDANGNAILDAFVEETGNGELQLSEATSAANGKVEIDDVTNTIIYTPAAQSRIAAIKVSATLTK